MTINNWELGVVLPIKGDDNVDNGDRFMNNGLPIPFERPLRKYSTTDKPWVWFDDYSFIFIVIIIMSDPRLTSVVFVR